MLVIHRWCDKRICLAFEDFEIIICSKNLDAVVSFCLIEEYHIDTSARYEMFPNKIIQERDAYHTACLVLRYNIIQVSTCFTIVESTSSHDRREDKP